MSDPWVKGISLECIWDTKETKNSRQYEECRKYMKFNWQDHLDGKICANQNTRIMKRDGKASDAKQSICVYKDKFGSEQFGFVRGGKEFTGQTTLDGKRPEQKRMKNFNCPVEIRLGCKGTPPSSPRKSWFGGDEKWTGWGSKKSGEESPRKSWTGWGSKKSGDESPRKSWW